MKSSLAKIAIVIATIIWGGSFVIMKDTLDNIDVFYLLAARFTIAGVILSAVFCRRFKKLDKKYILHGSIMGAFLISAYIAQTFGLQGTTPGKNAFLTAVYCLIVPFLIWGIRKKRPDIFNFIAAILCIIGIGLVSVGGEGAFSMGMGDALTLLGGLMYAFHIVAVDTFAKDRDIFLLTVIQFLSASVFSWILALIFNTPPQAFSYETIGSLAYLGIMATAVGLGLQNIGQKYTEPATASLLLSLEAVFGVLFSVLLGREILTARVCIGFAIIFIAIVISETKLGLKKQ